jgi:hypothetical protein
MLVDFLKSIKEGTQVYFIISGVVMGGDLMKVDYENEFIQLRGAIFQNGLTVPFFILPFANLQAWGVRPR